MIKPEKIALLKDLADVLEKHKGGLLYTRDDDGIYITQKGDNVTDWANIKWPSDGDVSFIRGIVAHAEQMAPGRGCWSAEKAQELLAKLYARYGSNQTTEQKVNILVAVLGQDYAVHSGALSREMYLTNKLATMEDMWLRSDDSKEA